MATNKSYEGSTANLCFYRGALGKQKVQIVDDEFEAVILDKETAIAMANDILAHYGIKQNSEIE